MLQRGLCVEPTCHYKSAFNDKVLKLCLAVCETNCVCVCDNEIASEVSKFKTHVVNALTYERIIHFLKV